MRVGLIGSTGLVGGEFLKILAERKFPLTKLVPFASEKSVGKPISFMGNTHLIEPLNEENIKGLDLLFVASGEDVSLRWTPVAKSFGVYVIDNSSAFRLDSNTPLVCPEVNGEEIKKENFVYANPNCSTIQLVVLLNALKKAGEMKDITVASYQAVSGAGTEALDELKAQSSQLSEKTDIENKNSSPENNTDSTLTAPKAFPKQIAFNCIPQIGSFDPLGFSSEEQKIMKETKKILSLPNLKVSAQTVRVPIMNGHAESIWVNFSDEIEFDKIREALTNQEGLVYNENDYDTQAEVSGLDPVYVSRVRRDIDFTTRWLFWCVADNIRKGAALNAIQIAEKLLPKIS